MVATEMERVQQAASYSIRRATRGNTETQIRESVTGASLVGIRRMAEARSVSSVLPIPTLRREIAQTVHHVLRGDTASVVMMWRDRARMGRAGSVKREST